MKPLQQHFIASTEDFHESEVVALDHTDAIVSAADAHVEAQKIDLETTKVGDAIVGATTDITSLESLIEALQDAREVGMESASAQFMHIQLGTIKQRYGASATETNMPSMESFRGRQSRVAASISLEGVAETIKKIWAWLKERFQEFIKLIKKQIDRMTRSLDYVYNEADKVKQFVRRNAFTGGKKIDLGRAGLKIAMNGKIDQDFISPLNTVGALGRVGDDTLNQISDAVVARFQKAAEGEMFSLTAQVMIPASFQVIHSAAADSSEVAFHASPLLPGDRHIMVSSFNEGNDDSARGGNGVLYKSEIKQVDVNDKTEASTEAISLDYKQVFELCQRIQKTVASLRTSRGHLDDYIKDINNRIDEIAKKETDGSLNQRAVNTVAGFIFKNACVYGPKLQRNIELVSYDILIGYLTYAKKSAVAGLEKGA